MCPYGAIGSGRSTTCSDHPQCHSLIVATAIRCSTRTS
jgi:hypothetical protein